MARNASGAAFTWDRRNARKQELEILMRDTPSVYQVVPPENAPKISMVGQSEKVQRQAVEMGRAQMRQVLESIGL